MCERGPTVLRGGVGIGEGIGSGLGRGTTGHALLRCAAGHCGTEIWSAGQGEASAGDGVRVGTGDGVRVGTGDGVRVGTGDDGDKETGCHADGDVGKGNGNLGDGHEVMGSDGACAVSSVGRGSET